MICLEQRLKPQRYADIAGPPRGRYHRHLFNRRYSLAGFRLKAGMTNQFFEFAGSIATSDPV
jgi:hypothetical protein